MRQYLIFIILSFIFFWTPSTLAAPIKSAVFGYKDLCQYWVDPDWDCNVATMGELDVEITDKLDNLEWADLVLAPWAFNNVNNGADRCVATDKPYDCCTGWRTGDGTADCATGIKGIRYYTAVYDYLRDTNSDIYIIEYANPRNWAGGIWSPWDAAIYQVEGRWLHDPGDESTAAYRVVPDFRALPTDCPAAAADPGSYYREFLFSLDSTFNTFAADAADEVMYYTGSYDGYEMDGFYLDNIGTPDNPVNNSKPEALIFKIDTCQGLQKVIPDQNGTTTPHTLDTQHLEHYNTIKEIRNKLDTEYSFTSSPAAGSREILMPINVGWAITDTNTSENCDGSNCTEKTLVKKAGSFLTEGGGWFANNGGSAIWQYNGTGILTETQWKDHVDTVKWAMDEDVEVVILGKKMAYGTWAGAPESKYLFIYASMLLACGASGDPNCFLYYDTDMSGWGGWAVDLGEAVGDYYLWQTSPTNIYARRFTKGYVFVNPTATNVSNLDPSIYYQRFDDNTINFEDWQELSAETNAALDLEGYSAEVLFSCLPTKPSITDPTGDETEVPLNREVDSGAYANPSGCEAESHVSSDWEISTDSSFNSIVRSSYGDTTTGCTNGNYTCWTPVQGHPPNTDLYIRVRHNNGNGASAWSDTVHYATVGQSPQGGGIALLVTGDNNLIKWCVVDCEAEESTGIKVNSGATGNQIFNTTIVDCGTLGLDLNANIEIKNTLANDNAGPDIDYAGITVTAGNNNFEDPDPQSAGGTYTSGTSDWSKTQVFYDFMGNNFKLRRTSDGVDAGTDTIYSGAETAINNKEATDASGDAVSGAGIDIGSFESDPFLQHGPMSMGLGYGLN